MGVKKGRYLYEVRAVESHNPSEGWSTMGSDVLAQRPAAELPRGNPELGPRGLLHPGAERFVELLTCTSSAIAAFRGAVTEPESKHTKTILISDT